MKINTMQASFPRLKKNNLHVYHMYKAVFFVEYEWSIAFLSHINIYVINNIRYKKFHFMS